MNNEKLVQSLSHVWFFAIPWTAACQASLYFTVSQSLLKLMSIELVMSSNHLILCRVPFSRLQSFPTLGSFQMSRFFTSGAKVLEFPMNIQDWFALGWTGWISLQSKGLSRVSSRTTIGKYQFCWIWNKTELETTENPMGFRLCPSLKSKSESHWIG